MKNSLALFILISATLLCASMAACNIPNPNMECPLASAYPSPRVPNFNVEKICQITGEYDVETGEPTLNQTATRASLYGTDLGASFEHKGKLYFLFGDSSPVNPGSHIIGDDPIAASSDWSAENCLNLQFLTRTPNEYQAVAIPGTDLGIFNVPMGGYSANDKMYIFATTDAPGDNTMGRSLMAVSKNDGYDFEKLYDVSNQKFINIAPVLVDSKAPEAKNLPQPTAQNVLLFGSGAYRTSNPYLAVMPTSNSEDKTSWRFFSGYQPGTSTPTWSQNESDAQALFEQPCIGELSIAFNPFLKKYMMLFNCAGGIQMRLSATPWGPWSDSNAIFMPDRDQGFCHFMHRGWVKFPKLDLASVCDCISSDGIQEISGATYGPYLIPSMTTSDGKFTSIYFTMSTANPYQVVLMRARIAL